VGFDNPPLPWSELERRLSGRGTRPLPGDGGDSPAWSRKRPAYEPPVPAPTPATRDRPTTSGTPSRRRGSVPYAELHAHSNFSFLDGASHPEELAEEAVRLGLDALALTDHDGLYGVVRFAEAARELGLPTIFGAELTLGRRAEPVGEPDPGAGTDERHLVVLARGQRGYARLSRAISHAHLRGSKGVPRLTLGELAAVGGTAAPRSEQGGWLVLTGCRKGAVPAALETGGPGAARHELERLAAAFGRANVAVELWDHGHPLDSARNEALARVAVEAGVELVATGNAHYATPSRRRLATALAAVRSRRSLDEVDGWLPAAAGAHLRSGAEQARRFARFPGVVERTAELAKHLAFDLKLVAPSLPPFEHPDGLDEMTFLRQLVERGGEEKYGARGSTDEQIRKAWAQIDHELAVIEQMGFPGYFLIVWEIADFCRQHDIYCQGRGSAANSAVCYALGITIVDAVRHGLLFERFLSPEREGYPDIDLDIESDRREEVIQHVYRKHGRLNAAQVANVITYRPRSAVRDMAKALGYAPGQQDAWSKQVDRWSRASAEAVADIPADVLDLAGEVEGAPRHLGIHSGGMVLCDRPVVEVCPVEWARMEDRSVLQWDKDDCALAGLVKFDLLGLGMLSALHGAVDLVKEAHEVDVDLSKLGQDDPDVYDMLCRADSVGVFQVESRAQMATLPRLKPREFYDLVVEVALIRPGPIQGGSVHPYIRRHNGQEEPTYLHPLTKPALEKTYGVPLFQEQMMRLAVDVAGFTAGEADQLRQAMGSKRSEARMERLRARFFAGMAENGITGEVADAIFDKLKAFANFGFPESHSVSFAALVYSSAWLKLHYPAAFCAALLNAQPMGFYSPHTLVQDARRHGVEVRVPSLNASGAGATLVWTPSPNCPHTAVELRPKRPQPAVLLGLSSVRGLGDELAERIVAERAARGPYRSMEELQRRVTGIRLAVLEALAVAGAFDGLPRRDGEPMGRREALWAAGAVAQVGPGRLPGVATGVEAPTLPGMSRQEESSADLWSTGISYAGHPTRFVRDNLSARGVVTVAQLGRMPSGSRVVVGGVVTHRQRPATAGGVTFINLEDETGLLNVVCSKGCWSRYRRVARTAPALLVRGRLERGEGVVNLVAEKLEPLPVQPPARSRDFR
jgi:error-prone DNA polymerase